jgi:flagellar hook assembly protein FlgD
MIGKVGQGGAPMMRAPVAGDSMPSGVDFQNSGVEVGASVKVGRSDDSASSAEPKFSEVWKSIQSQYGSKSEKPREAKKTLGKDDFLKLMIMQMKYQDPSKPFDMEKMGAEMAQLSSMEQLQNLNQTMKQLTTRDQPMERMAMTGMIGKVVSVDRSRFPHNEGESQPLKFSLPVDAAQLSITIMDQTGTAILEQDLGPTKKGENSFNWDGNKANMLPAKAGNYSYLIRGKDVQGREIRVQNSGTSRVVGVSFEGQKPVLLIGDAASPEKVFMENIARIIDDGGLASAAATIPGAKSLQEVSQSAQPNTSQIAAAPDSPLSKFFTFRKGEGAKPIDPTSLSPEDIRAIQGYQAQMQAQPQPQMEESSAESGAVGFANGLGVEE